MSRTQGFEDRWRDRRRDWRVPEAVLSPARFSRARLERIARGAPEVFVRVTGRPRTQRALADHLNYISRGGVLELKGPGGLMLKGREEADALADGWAFVAGRDTQGRAKTPMALSVVFGLPPGHDPQLVERAAQAFVEREFMGHDHVLVAHTDRPHPHVHVLVRWLGEGGHRLPSHRNAALAWREGFAAEVRSLGVEAEASPRWARGVMRRGEPYALRQMRKAAEAGRGPTPKADVGLLAIEAAAEVDLRARPLEIAAARRQLAVRRAYLQLSQALGCSPNVQDRRLAGLLQGFVQRMPAPLTPRLERLRQLQASRRAPPAPMQAGVRASRADPSGRSLVLEEVRSRLITAMDDGAGFDRPASTLPAPKPPKGQQRERSR
ncbi:MAG: hypothetical protein IT546_06015 [Caulobacteraceae bacterium]|nr:hypothetical protein [Caulobacteraceae bacterium]